MSTGYYVLAGLALVVVLALLVLRRPSRRGRSGPSPSHEGYEEARAWTEIERRNQQSGPGVGF